MELRAKIRSFSGVILTHTHMSLNLYVLFAGTPTPTPTPHPPQLLRFIRGPRGILVVGVRVLGEEALDQILGVLLAEPEDHDEPVQVSLRQTPKRSRYLGRWKEPTYQCPCPLYNLVDVGFGEQKMRKFSSSVDLDFKQQPCLRRLGKHPKTVQVSLRTLETPSEVQVWLGKPQKGQGKRVAKAGKKEVTYRPQNKVAPKRGAQPRTYVTVWFFFSTRQSRCGGSTETAHPALPPLPPLPQAHGPHRALKSIYARLVRAMPRPNEGEATSDARDAKGQTDDAGHGWGNMRGKVRIQVRDRQTDFGLALWDCSSYD